MHEVQEELTVRQIAKAAGISTRTVRHYAAAGVFEPPPFRGAATRYGKQHLERLLAIQALRKQNLKLDAIKARLEAEAAARAEAARKAASAEAEAPGYPAETWERVVLLPGLELLVSSAGGAILRRLAGEIYARYGSRSG